MKEIRRNRGDLYPVLNREKHLLGFLELHMPIGIIKSGTVLCAFTKREPRIVDTSTDAMDREAIYPLVRFHIEEFRGMHQEGEGKPIRYSSCWFLTLADSRHQQYLFGLGSAKFMWVSELFGYVEYRHD